MPKPFDQFKEVISTITSLDASEIMPDDIIAEVVQGEIETQVPRIVSALNSSFQVELDSSHILELAQDEDHLLTMQELLDMIQEELDF